MATSKDAKVVLKAECEAWFEQWIDDDAEVPRAASAAVLDDVPWPAENGTPLQYLFAFHVYELAGRWADAARCCILAAVDADLRHGDLLRTVDAACQAESSATLGDVLRGSNPNASISSVLEAAQRHCAELEAACTLPAGGAGLVHTSSTASAPVESSVESELEATKLLEDATMYFTSKIFAQGDDSKFVSPLVRIQHLLFYADGYHILQYGAPLFLHPPIAMRDGPVYQAAHACVIDMAGKEPSLLTQSKHSVLETGTKLLLDKVFDALGTTTAAELSTLSHEEVPWAVCPLHEPVSQPLMVEWFKHSIARDRMRGLGLLPSVAALTRS